EAQRHRLRPLDLLRRPRPPRARGDRVVVGDHHAPAPLHPAEGGDHPGARRAQVVAEDHPVVDEGADLEGASAGIDEASDPLAGGELALLMDAGDVLVAPAGVHLRPALAEPALALAERLAVVAEGALVGDL